MRFFFKVFRVCLFGSICHKIGKYTLQKSQKSFFVGHPNNNVVVPTADDDVVAVAVTFIVVVTFSLTRTTSTTTKYQDMKTLLGIYTYPIVSSSTATFYNFLFFHNFNMKVKVFLFSFVY